MARSSDFMGLSKRGAQNLAEAQNLIFRLISIDGEPFLAYPDDVRDDRVCVEINDSKVTRALIQ